MKLARATIGAWAALAATAAQAAAPPPPCVTRAEAASLFTAVLPDLLTGLGQKCSTALPESATLRAGLPPILARYRPASDTAWPRAMAAFARMSGGPEMAGIDPALLRPLIGPMIAGAVAQDIKPADCARIDEVATLLAPLPGENVGALVAVLAEVGLKGDAQAKFRICPATAPVAPPAPAAKRP